MAEQKARTLAMPILVVNPRTAGSREFKLGPGPNYAGRGQSNHIKIDDPSVSTRHAQIVVENGQVIITDLGSMNGTYINGAQVREAILLSGQTFSLGAVELRFEEDPPEPEMVEGVPVPNAIAAEALRAARERLFAPKKK
jgi:pSer/pThr/pTyr-binding forkhead associated (FHA) protein